jgi:hypothetical protein
MTFFDKFIANLPFAIYILPGNPTNGAQSRSPEQKKSSNMQQTILHSMRARLFLIAFVTSMLLATALSNATTSFATEYLVRADGAVIVLSGSVSVNYIVPGDHGSVNVDVAAGYSFNPVTGVVVPTSASDLHNIIADINTDRPNAELFKTTTAAAQLATLVVRPTRP